MSKLIFDPIAKSKNLYSKDSFCVINSSNSLSCKHSANEDDEDSDTPRSHFSKATNFPYTIYEMRQKFLNDECDYKIDLLKKLACNEYGDTWICPLVRSVENIILSDETYYLQAPRGGLESLREAILRYLFGLENMTLRQSKVFSIQTAGASSSIRVASEFLVKVLNYDKIYYPQKYHIKNLSQIIRYSGYKKTKQYRLWDIEIKGFNIKHFLSDLVGSPPDSVVLLPFCADHTGCCPTKDEWVQIAEHFKTSKSFPLFFAIQIGLTTGDVQKDAWPLHYFASQGIEYFCASSFSNEFQLTSEPIGYLVAFINNKYLIPKVKVKLIEVMSHIFRGTSLLATRIVTFILSNPEYYQKFQSQCRAMVKKYVDFRKSLRSVLEDNGAPGNWSYITEQKGHVCCLALTEEQCSYLVTKHHVYIENTGCFVITGEKLNLQYIAKAIDDTLRKIKS